MALPKVPSPPNNRNVVQANGERFLRLFEGEGTFLAKPRTMMDMKDWKLLAISGWMLIFGMSVSISRAADQPTAGFLDETECLTLFAFDRVSIPHTQNLRLEMREPTKHPANPVVPRGKADSPDARAVQFYGSVIREGGKFRMWYVAVDDDTENKTPYSRWRAAYAESDDGVKWIKPNLGLVEYRGNKHNNLIQTDPAPLGFVNLKVLADPDDPNPERRYKISTHVYFHHNTASAPWRRSRARMVCVGKCSPLPNPRMRNCSSKTSFCRPFTSSRAAACISGTACITSVARTP